MYSVREVSIQTTIKVIMDPRLQQLVLRFLSVRLIKLVIERNVAQPKTESPKHHSWHFITRTLIVLLLTSLLECLLFNIVAFLTNIDNTGGRIA